MENINEKYQKLIELLSSYKSVAVAFSGGVDSSLLAFAAKEALGLNALAITLTIHSMSDDDIEEAEDFCRDNGIRQMAIAINELDIPGFAENPPDRCYICKKSIYKKMLEVVKEEGIEVLAEGSNIDDLSDYRPGKKALDELEILSPLQRVGLSKEEIRTLLKQKGLKVWEKPSAACLASRFAYGERITEKKLRMVEKAEKYLRSEGFLQGLRVRMHGELARIEVDETDIKRLTDPKIRSRIYGAIKEMGFSYVTMDMKGYRMGSMNETLQNKKAIIFDLDGTLLNTIGDLTTAINQALVKYGESEVDCEQVRSYIGKGNRRLLARAITKGDYELGEQHPNFEEMYQDYVDYYNDHACDNTYPYEGIKELLSECKKRGLKLAVLSNKVQSATGILIDYFFADTFDSIHGDREGVPRKPAPDSTFNIMEELGVNPEETLFVGDSVVDSQTSTNAGLKCVLVTWGFGEKDSLKGDNVVGLINNADELIKFI